MLCNGRRRGWGVVVALVGPRPTTGSLAPAGGSDSVIDYTIVAIPTIALVRISGIVTGHLMAAVSAHERAVQLSPPGAARPIQYPCWWQWWGSPSGGWTWCSPDKFPSGNRSPPSWRPDPIAHSDRRRRGQHQRPQRQRRPHQPRPVRKPGLEAGPSTANCAPGSAARSPRIPRPASETR